MIQREAIYSALASKLEAIPGIKTFSRKLLLWSDVPAAEQPALFMACANQTVVRAAKGLSSVHHLPVKLYLYVSTAGDPKAAPSILLNELLDAIEAALEPDTDEETQTLGGLVSHCWINGDIETDESLLGDQAIAIIPLDILVP